MNLHLHLHLYLLRRISVVARISVVPHLVASGFCEVLLLEINKGLKATQEEEEDEEKWSCASC